MFTCPVRKQQGSSIILWPITFFKPSLRTQSVIGKLEKVRGDQRHQDGDHVVPEREVAPTAKGLRGIRTMDEVCVVTTSDLSIINLRYAASLLGKVDRDGGTD